MALRALVVDDSVSMRRLLAELLAERSYEVLTTGTGETALRLHEEKPFDLMLVDWTLPGISGLDVCRAGRRRPNGEDIALLVVTGRDRPEDLHAVMDAGASDYIAKPIRREALVEALMRCEPISALKLDAAPLGTSAAIPIQRSTELELPAFARNAPPPSDEVNRTVTDGLSLSAAPAPDLPEGGRKPSALPQSFSLSDPGPMATEMPEGFSAPPSDLLQDPSTKRNPFRRPTAAPVIAAPPPAGRLLLIHATALRLYRAIWRWTRRHRASQT